MANWLLLTVDWDFGLLFRKNPRNFYFFLWRRLKKSSVSNENWKQSINQQSIFISTRAKGKWGVNETLPVGRPWLGLGPVSVHSVILGLDSVPPVCLTRRRTHWSLIHLHQAVKTRISLLTKTMLGLFWRRLPSDPHC